MEHDAPSESVRFAPPVTLTAAHPESAPRGDGPVMPLTLFPPTHGPAPTDTPHPSPAADRGRTWLARLFAGDFAFPALAPGAPAPGRTPAEADAVCRALACRDLFVIDAADRLTRERLIADLARTAAARGERVLVLSPNTHAADLVAEHVTGNDFPVLRALAPDENPHRLPPAVSRLTSHELGHARVERMKREAADTVSHLSPKLPPLTAAVDALARMRELVERIAAIEGERESLRAHADQLDGEIRAETGTPFAGKLAALRADAEVALKPLTEARTVAHDKYKAKEAELAAAHKHIADEQAEAAKKPGFISRLFGKTRPPVDFADLDKKAGEIERDVKTLAEAAAKAAAELGAATTAAAAKLDRAIAAEAAARRAVIEQRLAALAVDREKVGGDFRDQIPYVFAAGFGVVTPDAAAVARVTEAVRTATAAVEGPLCAARDRLRDLTCHGGEHVSRMLGEARVVIGTPGSLNADPVFALHDGGTQFDLLVLDHAEQLAEPDFANLSRLADRWVLAGDASGPHDHRSNGTRHHGRPTLLARIARLLDREPWAVEGERLVCRLSHVTPDQRRHVTREPLLDHPHIELRLAADENGQAVLAEVAFPASTSIADAKRFLIRETDNVLLRPLGECVWHVGDGHLTACWPAAESCADEAWVELESGVREKVVGLGPAAYTAAIDFDPAAGWDAEGAAAWLAARVPAPSPGRLAVLPRSSAPHPARSVSHV